MGSEEGGEGVGGGGKGRTVDKEREVGGRGEESDGREHWVGELSKGKGGEGEEEDDSGEGEVEEGLVGGEAGHFELVRDEGELGGEIGSETEEVEYLGGEAGCCLERIGVDRRGGQWQWGFFGWMVATKKIRSNVGLRRLWVTTWWIWGCLREGQRK